jgi:mannose-6-phosphate isomerase-like protein (cupin superfamily)
MQCSHRRSSPSERAACGARARSVGESIENPISGERIVWTETAASSGGELLAADLYLRPGAAVAATHRHPRQEERFRVAAGRVALEIEGEQRDLDVG